MFSQCPLTVERISVYTMFLLYFFGICLALNASHLVRVEQVSCARYNSHTADKLRPSGSAGLDAGEEHALRLEIIKQKILKKLGLKEAPQVDARLSGRIASMDFQFSNRRTQLSEH